MKLIETSDEYQILSEIHLNDGDIIVTDDMGNGIVIEYSIPNKQFFKLRYSKKEWPEHVVRKIADIMVPCRLYTEFHNEVKHEAD